MEAPIDRLTDAELNVYNRQYRWITGTNDSKGRVLGLPRRLYKIPERRIQIGHDKLNFSGKTIVEFGSLEGAHTVALCRLGKSVVALEGQDVNIEKTKIRCSLYGVSPEVRKADLETELPPPADLYFHSGVLYHLQDPVGHLLRIMPLTKELVLDTHHFRAASGTYKCPVDRKTYPCWTYNEPVGDVKAGLRSFSRWISIYDIVKVLRTRFERVEVARNEVEGNGPRATFVASGVR